MPQARQFNLLIAEVASELGHARRDWCLSVRRSDDSTRDIRCMCPARVVICLPRYVAIWITRSCTTTLMSLCFMRFRLLGDQYPSSLIGDRNPVIPRRSIADDHACDVGHVRTPSISSSDGKLRLGSMVSCVHTAIHGDSQLIRATVLLVLSPSSSVIRYPRPRETAARPGPHRIEA